jgi:hypothetical protein
MMSYRTAWKAHLPCREPDGDIGYGAWHGEDAIEMRVSQRRESAQGGGEDNIDITQIDIHHA